jgi:Na+-driven multidrug efflux pump
MPIEAMGFTFMHGLLGAADARRVMIVGVGTQWLLFLPLAYLFGPVLGFGLLTIWILQGGSRFLSAFLYVTLWRGRHWQRIVV